MKTAAAVKERPILFSGPMVRALLGGTKTQTRRTMKPQPVYNGESVGGEVLCHNDYLSPDALLWKQDSVVGYDAENLCPYGRPGERLWVRETFCHKFDDNGCFVYNAERNLDPTCCWYAADGVEVTAQDGDGFTLYRKDGLEASPWSPSIHMPRWASRIVLEITDVRVQALQEITEADAIAEGVERIADGWACPLLDTGIGMVVADPRQAYRGLWNSINGAGAWEANPYVWVLTFRRVTA